jgi:hypothetical protein
MKIRKRSIARVAVTAMSCAFSTHALAAEDSEFYAGIGFGKATSEAASANGADTFKGTDGSFRFLAGYTLMKYLAFELDYIDGGMARDFIGPYELELKTSSTVVSAVGTWTVGRWDLSAKAGYAFYSADQTIRLGNVSESKSHNDKDFAGGVAIGFKFTDRYSLRAEYETIFLDDRDFNNLSLIGIYKF